LKGSKISKRNGIVTVGHFLVEKESSVLMPFEAIDDETNRWWTVPMGYVLKAGDQFAFDGGYDENNNLIEGTGTKINTGDIVGLYDTRTSTIFNPRFKDYFDTKYENSNGVKHDSPPRRFMSNCLRNYGSTMFVIDPVKPYLLVRDSFTFEMGPNDINRVWNKTARDRMVKKN